MDVEIRQPNLGAAIEHIGTALLEHARAFAQDGPDVDTRAHQIRKDIKQLRTLLKLIKRASASDAAARNTLSHRLQTIARTLTPLRTKGAHQAAFVALASDAAERWPQLTRALAEQDRGLTHNHTQAWFAFAHAQLGEAEENWHALAPVVIPYHALRGNVVRRYERAHRLYRRMHRGRASRELHDWRKRIKELRDALVMVRPGWPAVLGGIAMLGKRVSDALGDEHDLDELAARVEHVAAAISNEETADFLQTLTAARQKQRATALRDAARLFALKPDAFADLIGACVRRKRFGR